MRDVFKNSWWNRGAQVTKLQSVHKDWKSEQLAEDPAAIPALPL